MVLPQWTCEDCHGQKKKKRHRLHFPSARQIHPFNTIFTDPIKCILIEMTVLLCFFFGVLSSYRYFLLYFLDGKSWSGAGNAWLKDKKKRKQKRQSPVGLSWSLLTAGSTDWWWNWISTRPGQRIMGSSSEDGAILEAERNVPPSAEIIKNRKREGRGRDYCFSATLAIIWKLSWHSAIICSITTANSRGMSPPRLPCYQKLCLWEKTQPSLICERQGGTVTSNHPLFRFKLSDPCAVFHVSIKIQSPTPPFVLSYCLFAHLPTHNPFLPPQPQQ